MDDWKSWLASRTVWSAILALVGIGMGLFGYTISAQDQAEMLNTLSPIITTIGTIATIYYRVKATKKIG